MTLPRVRGTTVLVLTLTLIVALLPAAATGQDATPASAALPDGVTIVANGLDNPRNFTWDEDGTLYLAIAGVGGPTMGDIGGSPSGLTGGPTASVVTDGCATVVAGDLPSGVWEGVGWVWGTADVSFLDGQLYSLESGGGSDFGNFDTPSGVYRIEGDGSETLVADFSAWSRENPPEFVAPDYNQDGSLVDMFADGERLWAVDAVGARIVTVTPDGEITLFKDWSVDHPVPTGIVPDGEGGVYAGTLTAIPYPNGSARVAQIHADGTVEDVWTGLTAVTHLVMGPDGALYASEMATNTIEEEPFLPPDTGRIVRQSGPDSLEEVVTGLPYPVSFEFDAEGALYITAPAYGGETGEGLGALLRVDPSASLPVSLAGVDLSTPTCGAVDAAMSADTEGDAEAMAESEAVATVDLLQLPLANVSMGGGETFGITRLTFDAGGSQHATAGSGGNLLYVEAGSLTVTPVSASEPLGFIPAGADPGTAADLSVENEIVLEAGDTLVMPAGSEAEIRNDGDESATALAILTASDAALDAVSGVTSAVMAQGEAVMDAPGVLTLQRVTVPAGQRVEFAEAPVQTVAAGVDPRQAMILSGRINDFATNRGDEPVEAYLVIIEPAG
jgi:hypothetical protein